MLLENMSPIGIMYVIIKNNNNGATNKKALILYYIKGGRIDRPFFL